MKKVKRVLRAVTTAALALGIGTAASTSHAADRPINIVAFGDSVMWGQGLAEGHKFRSIVRDHIHALTPHRDVTVFNYSRSGAKIQSLPMDAKNPVPMLPLADPPGAPIQTDDPASIWGEVPWQLPSITKQSSTPMLPIADADVDIVLLNGGADDVGLTPAAGRSSILSFDSGWPVESTPPSDLNGPGGANTVHRWIWDNGPDRMARLLPQITAKYRNALVIVVGYFMPYSNQTNVANVGDLWNTFGPVGGSALAEGGLALRARWAQTSQLFYDMTNLHYQRLVNVENSNAGKARALFAKVDWDASNSFNAPSTLLWKLQEMDEAKAARRPVCDTAKRELDSTDSFPTPGVSYNTCLTASLGHPNVAGAARIAQAINSVLDPQLCPKLGVNCPFTVSGGATVPISDGDITFLQPSRSATILRVAPPIGKVDSVDGSTTDFSYTAPPQVRTSANVAVTFVPTDGDPGQSATVNIQLRPRLHTEYSFDNGTSWTKGCPNLAKGQRVMIRVQALDQAQNVTWSPLTPSNVVSSYPGGVIVNAVWTQVFAFNPPNGHVAATPPPSFTVRAAGTLGSGELAQQAFATCKVGMPGMGMTVQGNVATANVPAGANIQFFVPTITNDGASDPVPEWTVAGVGSRALTKVNTVGSSVFSLGTTANQGSTLSTTTKDGRTLSVQVNTVAP